MTFPRFFLGFCIYSLTTLVVLSAALLWWGAAEFTKPGPLKAPSLLEIQPGSGLRGISAQLTEAGAIENPYIFIFGTRLLGAQGDLKAGEYEFTPGMSARDVMAHLKDGKTIARRFTIREGLTSFEIVNIIKTIEGLEGEIAALPKEGALLPETYDYKRGETREAVIARLQQAMTTTIDELWETRAANLPFSTKEEALTLASIVEKETGVAEERKRVAGVLINRLRRGIALQTDPTVIYALTGGKPKNEGKGPLGRRLLSKDLEYDSPYNTYKYPGLPPGPIANPGRASIEAVLHPEEHAFIYFVADGSGGHIFAATLEEHNKNVAEWRKIRKQKK